MKTATKLFKNLELRFSKDVAARVEKILPVGTILTYMRKPVEGEAIEDRIYDQYEIISYEDDYDPAVRETYGWQDVPPAYFMKLRVLESGALQTGGTTTHVILTGDLLRHEDVKRRCDRITFDVVVAIDIPRHTRVFNSNTGTHKWVQA
jgi:hypothetical protein